jgi:hypothetical protein
VSIFRSPKGSYVRTTGDWFYQNSALAHAAVNRIGGSTAIYYALYNNDTTGRSLFVKTIYIDSSDSVIAIYYAQGLTQVGTLQTGLRGTYPLNPLWPAPVGQLYTGTSDLVASFIVFATSNAFSDYSFNPGPDLPLYVIPQGWNLVFEIGAGSSGNLETTFQASYQVISG